MRLARVYGLDGDITVRVGALWLLRAQRLVYWFLTRTLRVHRGRRTRRLTVAY